MQVQLNLGLGRGSDITTSQGDSLELVLTDTRMSPVLDALLGDGFSFAAAESFTAPIWSAIPVTTAFWYSTGRSWIRMKMAWAMLAMI